MKESDLYQAYRVGKPGKKAHRDVVIEFGKKSNREAFYESKKKIPKSGDPKQRLYINDNLTVIRQKLLFDARKFVRMTKIKGTWSQKGTIMVLKTDGSAPIAIRNHDDLRKAAGLFTISSLEDTLPEDENMRDSLSDFSRVYSDTE